MAQLNISLSPGDAKQIRDAAQLSESTVSAWLVDAARRKLGIADLSKAELSSEVRVLREAVNDHEARFERLEDLAGR